MRFHEKTYVKSGKGDICNFIFSRTRSREYNLVTVGRIKEDAR